MTLMKGEKSPVRMSTFENCGESKEETLIYFKEVKNGKYIEDFIYFTVKGDKVTFLGKRQGSLD